MGQLASAGIEQVGPFFTLCRGSPEPATQGSRTELLNTSTVFIYRTINTGGKRCHDGVFEMQMVSKLSNYIILRRGAAVQLAIEIARSLEIYRSALHALRSCRSMSVQAEIVHSSVQVTWDSV